MQDDGSPSSSFGGDVDLAERVELCWSPTAQLEPDDGAEVYRDLFEQLLSEQVARSRGRGQPLPKGQFQLEMAEADPLPGRDARMYCYLVDLGADRCRVSVDAERAVNPLPVIRLALGFLS